MSKGHKKTIAQTLQNRLCLKYVFPMTKKIIIIFSNIKFSYPVALILDYLYMK